MGDGESQEGQNWEAILYAAQQKLGNLILFVDDNKAQIDGYVSQINEMESYVDKFKSFHWDAVEINGHDYNAIHEAIAHAKEVKDKPSAIILHTDQRERLHVCRAHLVSSHFCIQRGYAGSASGT